MTISSAPNTTPISNTQQTSRAPKRSPRTDYVDTTMFRNPGPPVREVTSIFGMKPWPVFFKNDTPAQPGDNGQPGLIAKLQGWLSKLFG